MIMILVAAGVALLVSILLTPVLIRVFTKQDSARDPRGRSGQPSEEARHPVDGRCGHRGRDLGGLPRRTTGGLVFYGTGPTASGLLVLGLATALGGVGFIDDLIKIRRSRNLGLNKTAKTVGQVTAATIFGLLVLCFRNDAGLTPGSLQLSYVRDIATVTLPAAAFVLFVILIVSAWSNAVNFTDGLDGLAAARWRWSVPLMC